MAERRKVKCKCNFIINIHTHIRWSRMCVDCGTNHLICWFLWANIFYADKYNGSQRDRLREGEGSGRMEEICFLSAKISHLLLAVQSFQRFYLICVVGPTPSPRSHRACPFSHVNQSALGFYHAMQHISPFHCVVVVGPNIYDSLYWPWTLTDWAHRRQQIIIYHCCCAVPMVLRLHTVPLSYL